MASGFVKSGLLVGLQEPMSVAAILGHRQVGVATIAPDLSDFGSSGPLG